MAARQQQPSLFGPYQGNSKANSEFQDAFSLRDENDRQLTSVRFLASNVFYGCSVRLAPGKSLGLFATEDILAGETILVERPSLVHGPLTEEQDARFWYNPQNISRQLVNTDLVDDFMKLPEADQSDIMSLHNSHEEQFPSRKWKPGERPNRSTLVGKFLTNRFKISSELTGIYFRCAILNHSCISNCTFRILKAKGLVSVRNPWLAIEANQDIRAGDELTISYIQCGSTFEERQAFLFSCYGFRCVCSQCVEDKARLYPGGYDGYLFNSQKVALQQSKLANRLGRRQGRNMLTVVKAISGGARIFPRNGIILSEMPLMLITKEELKIIDRDSGQPHQDYHPMITRFLQLSAGGREKFLALCDWRREPSITDIDLLTIDDSMPSPERLIGIWIANSFPLDDRMEGVFPIISNLSHSCDPSCRVSWSPEQKTLDLVVIQPLKIGDQITICYDHNQIYELPVEGRQKYLKENYGFNCRCSRCIKWASYGINAKDNCSPRELQDLKLRPVLLYKLSESPKSGTPLGQISGEKERLGPNRMFGELRSENEIALAIGEDLKEKLLR